MTKKSFKLKQFWKKLNFSRRSLLIFAMFFLLVGTASTVSKSVIVFEIEKLNFGGVFL